MNGKLGFKAENTIIKHVLFSDFKKFCVPRYQRSYAWTVDQISEFWNDLISDDDSHFIGSLIFNKEGSEKTGRFDVIDGQQRLLTITIFAAVLRDIANSIDQDKASLYHKKDITQEDYYGKEDVRILPGESIKGFFKNTIQSKKNRIMEIVPQTKEQSEMKKAYAYLHTKVNNELNKFDVNESKLRYLDRLREKAANLVVIEILIENEEEAYEIFETTNARGVDLSVADLLKNLIFKKIPVKEDRDLTKEIWQDITKNVQETGSELKKFIRYFWLSKYAFVSEKKLFRAIKRGTTDWNKLLEDLWDASQLYNKLLEGSEDDFQDLKNGHKIYKSLFSIRLMNVSQCYVLFLSILKNLKKLEMDPTKIFQLIEKFTFQYSVVCKLPGNKVERIYSRYALRLEEAANSSNKKKRSRKVQRVFSDLRKEIKDERPSSEVFQESFSDLSYKNSEKYRKLIKYILGEINDYNAKTKEHKIDFNNVNIEHILPQKPDRAWRLSKKDIKGYVNKIGNLTLLDKRLNSKVQNKVPKEKIKELRQSQLPITQNLVRVLTDLKYKWNEEEILKRQEEFADISYDSIWNF